MKVDIRSASECWFWKASIDVNGYGQFGIGNVIIDRKVRTMAKAHRVAWIITNGEIPPGMYLCHKCDMPRCVNPSHLFLGTQTDNMRDCVEKNRHGFGRVGQPIYFDIERIRKIITDYQSGIRIKEIHKEHGISRTHLLRILKRHKIPLRDCHDAMRKLTDTEIRQIRELYAMGNISQAALGERFGVTQSNIGYLVRGSSWASKTGPLQPTRPKQKITPAQVEEIRSLHLTGEHTKRSLAERFGVSYSTICYSIHYRKASHASNVMTWNRNMPCRVSPSGSRNVCA